MSRGRPDYGIGELEIAESLDNQDTIMVANRGINTVDGLGRLCYYEDFKEGVMGWGRSALAPAAAAILFYGKGETGSTCVFMDAGINPGIGTSEIHKSFRLDGGTSVGVEFSFRVMSDNADIVLLYGFQSNGVNMVGGVKLSYDNKLYLRNDLQTFTQIDTFPIDATDPNWLSVKLVMSVETRKYERLIIGQKRYTGLSVLPVYLGATGLSKVAVTIYTDSQGLNNHKCYLGHVAITTDEP